MKVFPYQALEADQWDRLVHASVNGTFLHTRRFLSYHHNRFQDMSLQIRHDDGQLLAVFPAAVDPVDPGCVTSHPGITYGGLVRTRALYGLAVLEVLEACAEHYQRLGFKRLRYRSIPLIYHRSAADDDTYALFRLGARIWRCDLCSVIDHRSRGPLSRNRRAGLKRSQGQIEISRNREHLTPLWDIVETQLEDRHATRPVHTLAEIETLMELFPENILCATGLRDGKVVAGLILFCTPQVTRAQYSGASEEARQMSALDWVFDYSINESAASRAHYFDFGNSNEADGRILNAGLYRYKTGLGAGGLAQPFYELFF